MTRNLAFAVWVTFVIMAAGHSSAATFEPHKIGTVFNDVIEVGNGVQVPLPEGDWLLVANPIRPNNAKSNFYYPVLIEVKDNVLQRIIMVANSLGRPDQVGFSDGFTFYKECRRTDMLFVKEFINIDGNKQDCWYLNHFTMTLGPNSGAEFTDRQKYMEEHKIPLPINMLTTAYHFANANSRYLDVRVYHNPEAVGFAAPKQGDWRASDWHKDRIYLDPKKKEYADRLIGWGASWHDRVKEGFEGKLKTASPR